MRTRLTTLTLSFVIGAAGAAFAQDPAPQPQTPPAGQTPPAAAAPAQPTEPAIGFTSDAGMMFNVIKGTATADFEMVLGRLREALHKSENPARKQQAASWKVYKSTDPSADGNVMYIFMFDEAVKGVDYDPVKILSEAFPTEVNALYEKLKGAYANLNKAGLTRIMDMSTPGGM
ncbi:MAG: hypothetical protein H0X44_04135 [Acidobacteria bacterium]|nr:hypothetical protein [Acidobacteriota bacterium]